MPRRDEGIPSLAFEAAILKSHTPASCSPPPMAAPWIAAIVGSRCLARASSMSSKTVKKPAASGPETAAKSAPAQNAGPAPLTRTTRTSSRASTSSRAETIAEQTSTDSALRACGRSSVSEATPSRSERSSSAMSLDHGDDVALLHDAPLGHLEQPDRARGRRLHRDLHLHGLEDADRVTLGNGVALGDDDL